MDPKLPVGYLTEFYFVHIRVNGEKYLGIGS